MACCVVIRRARAADEAARAALLRECTHEHFRHAFLMFFFHELTLQCVVLTGAVLFIFCGASVAACAAVVPAAAAAVAAGVSLAHRAAAARAHDALRAELAGWVAEARGAPAELARPPRAPPVLAGAAVAAAGGGAHAALVVGTVSLVEWRGAEARGLLRGLAVARGWRRRGTARALAGAARGAAAAAGLHSLEAVLSAVQSDARAALHAAGWPLRGTYSRALLGAALTLPMLQLGLDLPAP